MPFKSKPNVNYFLTSCHRTVRIIPHFSSFNITSFEQVFFLHILVPHIHFELIRGMCILINARHLARKIFLIHGKWKYLIFFDLLNCSEVNVCRNPTMKALPALTNFDKFLMSLLSGFAASELCTRIEHAEPKVVIAANCGVEPNKVIR